MPKSSRPRAASTASSKLNPAPAPVDRFADIGAQRQAQRDTSIREITPTPLTTRQLPAPKPGKNHAFKPITRATTPAQVTAALAAERKKMAPYLRELSPALPSTRRPLVLRSLDWRMKTAQDEANFASVTDGSGTWENVSIPHYGPPAGRATAFYRTIFKLDKATLAVGSIWIRLEGADYRARVYVNGRCVGEHEGFFATFEFSLDGAARLGANTLLIELENDGVWQPVDGVPEGDKIYGATGPGWDGPGTGWHHCPAGMGLIGPVTIEARPRFFVHDVWARTLPDLASVELSVEVRNCDATPTPTDIAFAVFGENFSARAVAWSSLSDLPASPCHISRYLVTVPLAKARLWSPETPWLYRVQIQLKNETGAVTDTASRVFGVRTFRIDETTTPKGRLFLNDRPIRLRGANTMGYEQQSVMNGRFDELRDDLLLARITHFNFLRLTQRPVQREVYEAADRLGVMLQSDLPLFGYLRRTQFCEAVRQAGEMARHLRGHASSILASFINEPFPGHWRKVGHRHLNRNELETFFTAAAAAMRIDHPDIALKYVDGDYDPPAEGLPDSHMYTMWYQGHGLPFGKLHRGFFPGVKPDWCYGCGEYGAEGLDFLDLMRRRYPSTWLPAVGDAAAEAAWTPNDIFHAQSGRHQPLFYDRPTKLVDWVETSQRYQAAATKWQTEAYRRHDRLVSCAIHLFIDAWPAGWMKTIVDCERRPKPAWFTCRDALAPWLPMLRTDRFVVHSGESFQAELWLANDTSETPTGWTLRYLVEQAGKVVASAVVPARPLACAPVFQGHVPLKAPTVTSREEMVVRVALCDDKDRVINDNSLTITVWPKPVKSAPLNLCLIKKGGTAEQLAHELNARITNDAPVILTDCWPEKNTERKHLLARVAAGATLVLSELPTASYPINDDVIEVKQCGFGPLDFASRATGHVIVAPFMPDDFRYWHDASVDRISPLLPSTFQAESWTPILISGEAGWGATPRAALAAAEIRHGKGIIRVSLVSLAGRTTTNPAALLYATRLLGSTD